jgi:hypothetical protein
VLRNGIPDMVGVVNNQVTGHRPNWHPKQCNYWREYSMNIKDPAQSLTPGPLHITHIMCLSHSLVRWGESPRTAHNHRHIIEKYAVREKEVQGNEMMKPRSIRAQEQESGLRMKP